MKAMDPFGDNHRTSLACSGLCALLASLTHSLPHTLSLSHKPAHSLTHTHSLLTNSLTHSLTHLLAHALTNSLSLYTITLSRTCSLADTRTHARPNPVAHSRKDSRTQNSINSCALGRSNHVDRQLQNQMTSLPDVGISQRTWSHIQCTRNSHRDLPSLS